MVFNVTKSSDYRFNEKVELNTLEDLLDYCDKNGGQLVINHLHIDAESELEIYDTYRE